MDGAPNYIRIYLDDELLNEVDLTKTYPPDGFNPFHHHYYILINLAIGAGGGDPSETKIPIKLEVDYVKIYQKVNLVGFKNLPGLNSSRLMLMFLKKISLWAHSFYMHQMCTIMTGHAY